jgi:hypothetical protein
VILRDLCGKAFCFVLKEKSCSKKISSNTLAGIEPLTTEVTEDHRGFKIVILCDPQCPLW